MEPEQINRLLKEAEAGNPDAVMDLLREAQRRDDKDLKGQAFMHAWRHLFKWTILGKLLVINRWPSEKDLEDYYQVGEAPRF